VQGVSVIVPTIILDITISGANGLDTGAASAGVQTRYAVHVITNDDGSLIASLLSLSAVAPTLPAGYTKFRRVSFVTRNTTNRFIRQTRDGNWVMYTDATQFTYIAPTGTTSFADAIPPTSRQGRFHAIAPAQSFNVNMAFRTSGTSVPYLTVVENTTPNGNYVNIFDFLTDAGQQIDITNSGGAPRVVVLGYYDPI
jgi:hypothetical protein